MSTLTARSRETRSCAIPTCKNKRVGRKDQCGLSFHRFPKDPKIRRVWIDQCCLPDTFKADNASICSDHFESEDYERIYQKQLMGIENKSILKKHVIPHLNLPAPCNAAKNFREGLRSLIKTRYHSLMNTNDMKLKTSIPKTNVDGGIVNMKTTDFLMKDEAPSVESIIVDYESDDSFYLHGVEEISDPLENINSPIENVNLPIETVETEPDFKYLYYSTLEEYKNLKLKLIEIEKELEVEKKRSNDYQDMLTQIFTRGEIFLITEKKNSDSIKT